MRVAAAGGTAPLRMTPTTEASASSVSSLSQGCIPKQVPCETSGPQRCPSGAVRMAPLSAAAVGTGMGRDGGGE